MIAEVLDADESNIQILKAAVEGLSLLERGWRRSRARCPLDDYAPDVVRFFLANWTALTAAAEGVSATGASPIGTRGDPDARRTIVAIKADLEAATDCALEPLIRWQATARIYRRQLRFKRYLAFRAVALLNMHHPEPSAPLAEAICIERIARSLGWLPHDVCEPIS